MSKTPLYECKFLVPIVRDSTRRLHAPLAWQNLHRALDREFAGRTNRKALYVSLDTVWGNFESSRGRGQVSDESKEYLVALPQARLRKVRAILRRACITFDQESIYLAVAGRVEFVEPSREKEGL